MRLPWQQQQHSKQMPPAVPMQLYNGLVSYNNDRRPWSEDKDSRPTQFRRFIMTGLQDVQLISGTPQGRYKGSLINPVLMMAHPTVSPAEGWVTVYQTPRNPGAASYPPSGTGAAYAGYHFRGIDPLSYSALFQAGPGSQPANPGGPGKIAGPYLDNPMTG